MMSKIIQFKGSNHFLSNFHPAPVLLDGVEYPTVEHAYQAAKTFDTEQRKNFLQPFVTAGVAKQLGKHVTLRRDWNEQTRLTKMLHLLRQKFKHEHLKEKLLATGEKDLIEGNHWNDTFWGECPVGIGDNWLGRLLEQVRSELNGN